MRILCKLLLFALIFTFWTANRIIAQDSPTETPEPAETSKTVGTTAFAQFVGNGSNLGIVLNEGVGIGYNFTEHVGADVGVSLFTVRSPFSPVINHDWRWTTSVGDLFVDVRYTTKWHSLDINSLLTGSMPLSGPARAYTTGRVGADWFNHVEAHYKGLAPFLNFGAANETVDRYVLPRPYNIARPYQTFGFISNFEGGASYTVFRNYSLGASGYALVPTGTQKVFSRLVSPDSPVAGDADHHRSWNNAFEIIGNAQLARDNGYSGWLDVGRIKNFSVQVGYTYSVHYAYGTAYVMLRFDGTSLIRSLMATE